MQEASIVDFQKLDIRIGTVIAATANEKAKKPAFVVTIDFGAEVGTRTSSAQITELYKAEELVGRQVVAVINFPPRQVAAVTSEVLILGCYTPGGVVLLAPQLPVENGAKIG